MKVLVLLLLTLSLRAEAGCIPENNYFIPASFVQLISESDFKDSIKKVQSAYAADVKARGAILKINNMWSDGTVNSQAYQEMRGTKKYYLVDAFGGLARYPSMTKEAFIEVLCHEVGHHLGGAPKYEDEDWASDEGQADYFATLKCMKKLKIDSAAPSLVLASVLADLGNESAPGRSKRDKSSVKATNHDHPEAQCRLDTYDAGKDCTATGDLSETDPKAGSCHNYNSKKVPVGLGNRPRCWFYPKK